MCAAFFGICHFKCLSSLKWDSGALIILIGCQCFYRLSAEKCSDWFELYCSLSHYHYSCDVDFAIHLEWLFRIRLLKLKSYCYNIFVNGPLSLVTLFVWTDLYSYHYNYHPFCEQTFIVIVIVIVLFCKRAFTVIVIVIILCMNVTFIVNFIVINFFCEWVFIVIVIVIILFANEPL